MEPNLRDTPLRRFNTFWWAFGLFVMFAVALCAYRCFCMDELDDNYDPGRSERVEKIEATKAEQQKNIQEAKSDLNDLVKHPELFIKSEDIRN